MGEPCLDDDVCCAPDACEALEQLDLSDLEHDLTVAMPYRFRWPQVAKQDLAYRYVRGKACEAVTGREDRDRVLAEKRILAHGMDADALAEFGLQAERIGEAALEPREEEYAGEGQ
jgi:hypothetical protein